MIIMTKKMEEILGVGPLGGKRNIPGTVSVEGREHWYIEDDGSGDFDSFFLKLISAVQPPLHTRGGALTGGCELTLPNGKRFHAMSYKGDLQGWRNQISQGAKVLSLSAARAIDGMLVFSEFDAVPILECKARFY